MVLGEWYGEKKTFGKFSQFRSGKSFLQEVLDMPKTNQDFGLFLGAMFLTNKTMVTAPDSMDFNC